MKTVRELQESLLALCEDHGRRAREAYSDIERFACQKLADAYDGLSVEVLDWLEKEAKPAWVAMLAEASSAERFAEASPDEDAPSHRGQARGWTRAASRLAKLIGLPE